MLFSYSAQQLPAANFLVVKLFNLSELPTLKKYCFLLEGEGVRTFNRDRELHYCRSVKSF